MIPESMAWWYLSVVILSIRASFSTVKPDNINYYLSLTLEQSYSNGLEWQRNRYSMCLSTILWVTFGTTFSLFISPWVYTLIRLLYIGAANSPVESHFTWSQNFHSLHKIYNGMLVPVRTSFNLRRRREKTYNVLTKVDVDKLNAVKVVVSWRFERWPFEFLCTKNCFVVLVFVVFSAKMYSKVTANSVLTLLTSLKSAKRMTVHLSTFTIWLIWVMLLALSLLFRT